MSKLIPRKIKKACKGATLVYNKEYALTKVLFKVRRNTKWQRKAFAYIVRQEQVKLKVIEENTWALFQGTVKRYKNEQINSTIPERKGL
ncbi:hypothetical protein C7120_09295 [Prevotella sp. oral taxon 376]|uniref:hypothetical protein n=1 Tax=Prevotella sp. oral taxon 376 TaxID=712466 RepID=UPI000D1E49F1|nr:hypothetical protein [Prevotella sp. oral taxon 376]PTL34560.1 hypothetical protein C7120_08640 [Prevotella sp. oral taxon 376]PTL34683.1 hypothetical protein C7120_09295 [Prevotella sp. oral taxon 376]